MPADAEKLIEERMTIIQQSRTMLDESQEGKREFDEAAWRNMNAEIDKLDVKIKAYQLQEKREQNLANATSAPVKPEPGTQLRTAGYGDPTMNGHLKRFASVNTEEYAEDLRLFMREAVMPERAKMIIRALQADLDTQGGYMMAPTTMAQKFIQNVDNLTFIRAKATKFTVARGGKLGALGLANDIDDATWTTELKTGQDSTGPAFNGHEFQPSPVAKRVKLSNTLIQGAMMDIAAFVLSRLEYKHAITEEKAFLLGTGVNQPLGLFTAANEGIPTSCDISAGNTATALTFDGLINAQYDMKITYRSKAEWLFHRTAIAALRKIKDAQNRYIWEPSVVLGQPDLLLTRPINESEYCPATFTTGQYVGMLADFSNYWVVDALNLQIKVLNELYAETDCTGYISRKETDGAPVLPEAFRRITLA